MKYLLILIVLFSLTGCVTYNGQLVNKDTKKPIMNLVNNPDMFGHWIMNADNKPFLTIGKDTCIQYLNDKMYPCAWKLFRGNVLYVMDYQKNLYAVGFQFFDKNNAVLHIVGKKSKFSISVYRDSNLERF